ncbi:MAG: lysoplasmalogenase family protein [Candidatus Thorarchaeota archaeon]
MVRVDSEMSFKTPIGILRLLIIIAILFTVALLQVFVGQLSPNWIFLSGSAMIAVLALLNFVDKKEDTNWSRFTLFMFLAMLVCFIADLLLAGVFYIIPGESLINGVLFFIIGHVFYIFALRNRSSLFLRSETPRLITRNLAIWIVGIIGVFVLVFFTLYDPAELVISVGFFGYGIFLISSLVFSITKWFDDFPKIFSLCLIIGFLLFFISDYILGYKILIDSGVLSGIEAVGVTYLLGQMTIHLSSIVGTEA